MPWDHWESWAVYGVRCKSSDKHTRPTKAPQVSCWPTGLWLLEPRCPRLPASTEFSSLRQLVRLTPKHGSLFLRQERSAFAGNFCSLLLKQDLDASVSNSCFHNAANVLQWSKTLASVKQI